MENSSFDFNSAGSGRLMRLLRESAAGFGVFLSEEQLNSFRFYYRELNFWNARFNLVASTESAADVFVKHFLDSLTLVPYLPAPDGHLIDIGTGGGFPGIPLKISLPGLKVTLLEASRKKVSFLKSLCRILKLEEMSILQERLEDLLKDEFYRNRFEMVVSRAALKLPEYLQAGKELVSPSGRIFAMKGAGYREELADVSEALADWDLCLADVHTLALPETGDFRAILVFKKL
ncbi:16S rRNA (guanine(527)-N(7))-methyltransferase RsmG [Syntrophus gentianae]|nr:16S rRNA (guanine(527)-N(7))-methyltransferase RsmG [Syntrophus gentianae]